MDTPLTIVLPIYNREARIRSDVDRVLEAVVDLTSRVEVAIVDEGSFDDSFDIASELAARYPQVSVTRRSGRGGYAASLGAQRQAAGAVVVMHDGASAIDPGQLRRICGERLRQAAGYGATLDDLRAPARAHAAMVAAHDRLRGFYPLAAAAPASSAAAPETRADAAAPRRRDASAPHGVGSVPLLPTPNFLGTIADFALGE